MHLLLVYERYLDNAVQYLVLQVHLCIYSVCTVYTLYIYAFWKAHYFHNVKYL